MGCQFRGPFVDRSRNLTILGSLLRIMIPDNSPFNSQQRNQIEQLLSGFNPLQKGWLSGFLASSGQNAVSSAPKIKPKLTVLYGTESGNAEELADRAVKSAKKQGFAASLKNMADISPADLAQEKNLLVIVSTWGDGDAPETAVAFHEEFMNAAIDLNTVKYSVCGLGDTSYEKFCEIGKQFDQKLKDLGAEQIAERADCDVDYEDAYESWLAASLKAIKPLEEAAADVDFITAPTIEYGKKNPFFAEVTDNVLLNGEGSAKETIHVEFNLEGSGLSYQPGDALAVLPMNCASMIRDILSVAKLVGTEEVEVKGLGKKILADALREDFDITALSKSVLKKLSSVCGSSKLAKLLEDESREELLEYLKGREIIDAIADFAPDGLAADKFASIFRKLPVRLYSIASSQAAHPDEVHLTVAAVRYEANGRSRKGVCSTYLMDVAKNGEKVPIFIQPNKNFRLPEKAETPIIMVGPGTGIAPFRSFIEQRATEKDSGKSWLFFGDQHFTYDFLYQLEWQDFLKEGALTKLDLAFSRDQPEKIYVQDKILEREKSYGSGFKTERTFMFVEMQKEWPRMFMRH